MDRWLPALAISLFFLPLLFLIGRGYYQDYKRDPNYFKEGLQLFGLLVFGFIAMAMWYKYSDLVLRFLFNWVSKLLA